ncbi:uncharacterized protein LOC128074945 [Tympanuchus pallidicinctus]|uniref:uncharacterized protein LOC128074945 n=1 Tax=Tympanuchus pallidicinctus TaxID=109042 RepID=UPI0022875BF7|nr:uncharacterized protein LOC128074945 [Tympanuchus pallidicinctus]
MQNLHKRFHRAVGAMWAAEIPLLLQCLQGKDESFPDPAEWECRLLKVQQCWEARCREVLACLKEPCSHMSHCGTGTASQMLQQSSCTPLWCCLFLSVPSPGGALGEERQAALMEGMLGQLGERLFLQTLSPEVCSNLGAREEAEGKGTLASPVLQQFLRASLDTISDEAWIEALSCELSRWLSSSPSSSGEKVGSPWLYPAVQLQVPYWGWSCGWCSAHVGCSCCFPGPCPPEGLSLQSARRLLKLGPAAALSDS